MDTQRITDLGSSLLTLTVDLVNLFSVFIGLERGRRKWGNSRAIVRRVKVIIRPTGLIVETSSKQGQR